MILSCLDVSVAAGNTVKTLKQIARFVTIDFDDFHARLNCLIVRGIIQQHYDSLALNQDG